MTPQVAQVAVVRAEVRDELRRADQKATTVLSLVGATLAGVVALTNRPLPTAAVVLLWLATVPIAISVLLLVSAIRPRLGDAGAVVPGTWLHAATATPAVFLAACEQHNPRAATRDVCLLAGIARTKYQRVRQALALLTTGLAVLGAALTVAALGGGA